MKTVEIIPGILEQDFPQIESKINLLDDLVSWVQIDIVDSLFNNTSFGDPLLFKSLKTNLQLELHMMITDPTKVVANWAEAGFSRLIGHVEGIENIGEFIKSVKDMDREVGLAIDIDTSVSSVEPYLSSIDCVLVMSIHTGKSGQSFMFDALSKIKKIRELNPNIPIEVDGGINPQTGKLAVTEGATRLVSTSYIFNSESIIEAVRRLESV